MLVATVAGDGGVKETVNAIADTHDQIILALIAVVATSVAALVYVIRGGRDARTAAQQATAANMAVNDVTPGEQHRLYDLVARIGADVEELKADQDAFDERGWSRLPADLNDAVALTQTVRSLQAGQAHCAEMLDTVLTELRDHVTWEQEVKWAEMNQKHDRDSE